jgi:hypothetical protein
VGHFFDILAFSPIGVVGRWATNIDSPDGLRVVTAGWDKTTRVCCRVGDR